jgi:hypothetical protein
LFLTLLLKFIDLFTDFLFHLVEHVQSSLSSSHNFFPRSAIEMTVPPASNAALAAVVNTDFNFPSDRR